MKRLQIKSKFIFITLAFFLVSLFLVCPTIAASDSNFQIQITAVCGNETQEWNEDCDGEDMGFGTCITKGFNSGLLSCNEDCTYNTEECVIIIPPVTTSTGSVVGEWSGSNVLAPVITQTTVILSGRAYPGSSVTLLKDSQFTTSVVAGPDANFLFSLSGLSSGSYVFSVFAEDSFGYRSPLLTLPVYLGAKTMTEIKGLLLSPTIAVDKSEVKKGEKIKIFGQSAPNANVTVVISSTGTIYKTTKSDITGVYSISLNTDLLDKAQHIVYAKAAVLGWPTNYSRILNFKVDENDVVKQPKKELLLGDLSEDWLVNNIDFFIGKFWYKKILNQKMLIKEKQILNGDGKIDLVDFSIMAYNWTG